MSEGHAGLAREPLDVRGLTEVDERIAGHGRADDRALEEKRRADHRQSVRLRDGDRGAILGLREASADTFRQQAGIVAVLVEQGVQRGRRRRSADDLLARVVERDGQMGHGAVFFQRGFPHGDVEERVVGPDHSASTRRRGPHAAAARGRSGSDSWKTDEAVGPGIWRGSTRRP